MDLREAGAVDPRRHWYYRAKALPLLDFARRGPDPKEIVDVGAGCGYFSERLAALYPAARLLQVDAGYAADEGARRRALPESVGPDALVLMMDVLEHVDDDAGLARSVVARCAGPCRFFLTAPAFPALWSRHDDFLGHKRRYRLPELEAVARAAGLAIESGYYYFGMALPGAWLKRRFFPSAGSELSPTPRWLGASLEAVCRAEHPLRGLNRLGGLTCVVEASRA